MFTPLKKIFIPLRVDPDLDLAKRGGSETATLAQENLFLYMKIK